MATPAPPPGFTLDENTPPLPPGFTIDDALEKREASAQPTYAILQDPESRRRRGLDAVAPVGKQYPDDAIAPAKDANFGTSLKTKIVEDPQTQRKIISESLFPDDPNGIKRVGVIDGRPVFVNDEGELQYVSGDLSNFGAAIVANVPEVVGATVGSFAASPVVGAALGAAGARGIKRAAAGLAFDEPQTITENLKDVAGEGALNLVAGGAGKGIAKFSDRGKMVDFTPQNVKSAQQARDYIKQSTGIDVDLAQASGNRKLIAIRAYAARFPGKSAELVQAADEVAEGQLDTAVNRVMEVIAQATPSEIAGARGVNAAQMTIRLAREKVGNEVRPLYDNAYAAVPEVTTATKEGEKILDYLKLPYFQQAFRDGQALRSLETGSAVKPRERTVENLLKRDAEAGTYESATTTVESTSTGARRITSKLTSGEKRDTPEGLYTKRTDTVHSDITRPSLAELDYTKRALDERIEAMVESGQRQRARALKIKRDEFVAALDALPNQQWQLARQRYGELIKANVDPLEQGPIGVLAKIKNPRLATAAAKIFNDENVTPAMINRARVSISQQDPKAWNGLVRQWMAQNWNKALTETQSGNVVNPAGKLRKFMFGTPLQKAKMTAMLEPKAAQAFDDLMNAAESLARTPISGSNTMRDTEIRDQFKGQGGVIFKWLTSPRQSITEAAEQKALERNTLAVTEAILDPQKQNQLRMIVRMSPSTKKAVLLTNILGGQVTQRAAASGATQLPSESTPPER